MAEGIGIVVTRWLRMLAVLTFLVGLSFYVPSRAEDAILSKSSTASAERTSVESSGLIFEGSRWDKSTKRPVDVTSQLKFFPRTSSGGFSGPRLLWDNVDHFVLSDAKRFQPVRFHSGRGSRQGNYDHWHESYFMSDGFTHLVNIGNTNDDGESGIRFWKGSHKNQWVVLIPSQPGYKLAIIRDGLIDAMVFDEVGRVIIGQLPPNDYGPPEARLHVRGMVDEKQFLVESAKSQQEPIVHVTDHSAKKTHLVVTARGHVGIGTDKPHGGLDVAGTIYIRGARPHEGNIEDSIEKHAEKLKKHRDLPALPDRRSDEQGREVIDVLAEHRALVKELRTAHVYIAQLNQELKQLRGRVEKLEKTK